MQDGDSPFPQPSERLRTSGNGTMMFDALRVSSGKPAFLVSVCLLAGSASGLHWYAESTGTRFRKAPAYLRQSLKRFDRSALRPYIFTRSLDLSPEEEQALGTSSYIQWILEDTSVTDPRSPLRWARMFISYYTDSPDQVPHVPDVCYLGAGFSITSGRNDSFQLPELAELGYDTRVPFRAMTFSRPGVVGDLTPTVVYTFGVNNVIRPDRNSVRRAMGNLTEKYAYFSKVEVTFGLDRIYPERSEVVRAAQKLLRKVLPVLIREHWPDLERLEEAERDRTRTGSQERTAPPAALGG